MSIQGIKEAFVRYSPALQEGLLRFRNPLMGVFSGAMSGARNPEVGTLRGAFIGAMMGYLGQEAEREQDEADPSLSSSWRRASRAFLGTFDRVNFVKKLSGPQGYQVSAQTAASFLASNQLSEQLIQEGLDRALDLCDLAVTMCNSEIELQERLEETSHKSAPVAKESTSHECAKSSKKTEEK